MSSPRVSVIVSTYNRPDALRLVLLGYARSTWREFEVVVADDGSTAETAGLVERMAHEVPYDLVHVRQDDRGFRLAAARNLGVRAARGEVLFFTDGDCIPYPDTLTVHAERCRRGRAQAGGRVFLDEQPTSRMLHEGVLDERLLREAAARQRGRLRRLQWKDWFYSKTGLKVRPKLVTANAAVHRDDFVDINGFDERFTGWGYEDEDLARRLRRHGVRVLGAGTESLVLHLFHPVHESHRPRAKAGQNYRYYKLGDHLTRPLKGLTHRAVESLSLELLGRVPATLKGCGLEGSQDAPEVSVVFGLLAPNEQPRGQVVCHLDPEQGVATEEALYGALEESLLQT